MGFRNGAYAMVWSVESVSATMTRGRISISRKNRDTGEYEQEFGGYVAFVGTAAASKAMSLHERDRIQLGDVDVTNRYDKEKNTTYTNFKVFSFELQDGPGGPAPQPSTRTAPRPTIDDPVVDDGESDLPF